MKYVIALVIAVSMADCNTMLWVIKGDERGPSGANAYIKAMAAHGMADSCCPNSVWQLPEKCK